MFIERPDRVSAGGLGVEISAAFIFRARHRRQSAQPLALRGAVCRVIGGQQRGEERGGALFVGALHVARDSVRRLQFVLNPDGAIRTKRMVSASFREDPAITSNIETESDSFTDFSGDADRFSVQKRRTVMSVSEWLWVSE